MKKNAVLCVLISFVGIVTGVYIFNNSRGTVEIIEKESYYSNFHVENDKVYIECVVTIKNSDNYKKTINLSARFDEDVNICLLKQAKIYALSSSNIKEKFEIKQNSKDTFDVVFVGDFGGTMKKHDRTLPDIDIDIVD